MCVRYKESFGPKKEIRNHPKHCIYYDIYVFGAQEDNNIYNQRLLWESGAQNSQSKAKQRQYWKF